MTEETKDPETRQAEALERIAAGFEAIAASMTSILTQAMNKQREQREEDGN